MLANELQKQHLRKGKNQPFVNWCNSSSHFMQIEFNQLPFRQSSSQLNGRSRDKASHQIFPRQPTLKKMDFMLNLFNYMQKLTCSRSSYDESTSVFELKLTWSPFSQVGFLWNFDFKKKEPTRRRSWLCINSISFTSTTTALFHCCKLYYQAFVGSTAIVVTKAVAYLDWGRSRGPAGTALHALVELPYLME